MDAGGDGVYGPNGLTNDNQAIGESMPEALRPRPVSTLDTDFYWSGVRAHELRIQRCLSCSRLRHPPTPMCPYCGSLERDHITASGRGSVLSFTIVHVAPPPFRPPFAVAVVELPEGTRVVAELIEVDPVDVAIGMQVQLDFIEPDPDLTLPVFKPVAP